MSNLKTVSIFNSRRENLKDPETCAVDDHRTCEIFRENAEITKNRNLKPCLNCKKFERLKEEFESTHPSRNCENCGEKFYVCGKNDNRKICDSCSAKRHNRPARYTKTRIRNNIRKGHTKKCLCVETGEIFRSVMIAACEYDVSPSSISKSARSGQPMCGYTWKYV